MTTWSIEHVLREYNVKSCMIKDGKVIEVQALTSRGVPAVGGLQIPIEDLEAVIQGLRAVSTENNKKG